MQLLPDGCWSNKIIKDYLNTNNMSSNTIVCLDYNKYHHNELMNRFS